MKFCVVFGEHLGVSVSVSRGVYMFIFQFIHCLVKNPIIFVAAFIVDVGRVIFGRGCINSECFDVQPYQCLNLINCCIIKYFVVVSFPIGTFKLSTEI